MIRDLRTIRLTRVQFLGLVVLSMVSSALIIARAAGQRSGPSGSQLQALLHRGPIIHRFDDYPAGSGASSSGGAGSGSSANPGGGSSPAAPALGSAASATTSSGSSSGAGASAGSSASSGSGSIGGTATGSSAGAGAGASSIRAAGGKVKHVFVIELTTTSYGSAFGLHSVARYLNGSLREQGTLLSGYRSLGGSELPDELAMVSGQAPTADTRANCNVYADFPPSVKPDTAGLIGGNGCVYPNSVITLADQVTASGARWHAYIDAMGSKTTCIHPNSGARDSVLLPFAGAQYDTRHNPFIYFHSLVDLGDCTTDDVDLTALPRALRRVSSTAELSFLAPSLCDDAASAACPNAAAGGLAGEDAFLKAWVPRILTSPAYRQSGMLMIVFAPSRPGVSGAASASGTSGTTGTTGTSGGAGSIGFAPVATSASATPMRTGALILSPFAKRGQTVSGTYDPYSALRSLEDLFGLTALGHAKSARSFVSSVLPGA